MLKIDYIVPQKEGGVRLDVAAVKAAAEQGMELTRSSLKTRDLAFFVNGEKEKTSFKVRPGDRITFEIPEIEKSEVLPQDIPFEVVYSDKEIAVVNKPYGMTVHPAKGHEDGTLVNALLYRMKGKLSSIGGVERPGIVHRLDKDTAGLMVVALTDRAHRILSDDFKDRKVKKTYQAIVKGHTDKEGSIDMPIGRSQRERKKMDVRSDGKQALTSYRTLEYLKDHSYVEIDIHTGRTHQIRVHFSHIRHPVAGDPLYSRKAGIYHLTGIALCAKKLEFTHPVTKKKMKFEIDLPVEFKKLLKSLRVNESK